MSVATSGRAFLSALSIPVMLTGAHTSCVSPVGYGPNMASSIDDNLLEAREVAATILEMSNRDIANMINRKQAQRRLTRLVQQLNTMALGSSEDSELALRALRRLGFEPAG
jgi:hypothetical protein